MNGTYLRTSHCSSRHSRMLLAGTCQRSGTKEQENANERKYTQIHANKRRIFCFYWRVFA